jgi:hypothetical protein
MGFSMNVTGITAAVDLFKSVKTRWDDVNDRTIIVAPTVNYAIYQEIGTSDIDARPFMRPAAEKVEATPEAMLEKYGSQAPNAGPVETLAIAVQNEAKKIADRKGVRDTGALINSITYGEL